MRVAHLLAIALLVLAGCGEGPAPDLPDDVIDPSEEAPVLMPLEEGNRWFFEHTVNDEIVDTLEVMGEGHIRGEEFVEVQSFDINWTGGTSYGQATHFWRYTDSSLVKLDRGLGVEGFVELEYLFPEEAGDEPWPIDDLSGGQYSYYTELYDEDTTIVTPRDEEMEVIAYRSFRENAYEDDEVDAYWMDYFIEDVGWVGRSYETEEGHAAWLTDYDLLE